MAQLWSALSDIMQQVLITDCHATCAKCPVCVLCCSARYALRPYLYLLLHTTVAAPAALWFGSESGTLPVLFTTLMSHNTDIYAHLIISWSTTADKLIYT